MKNQEHDTEIRYVRETATQPRMNGLWYYSISRYD